MLSSDAGVTLRTRIQSTDDLHHWHTLLPFYNDDHYLFTDWSDSSVAHPFFTMLVTLRSTAYRLNLDEDGPEMRRLRNAYLERWTTFESHENLRAAFEIAYRLAMINRSLSYQHSFGPLSEQYKVENDAIPGWLQDFLHAETKAQESGMSS